MIILFSHSIRTVLNMEGFCLWGNCFDELFVAKLAFVFTKTMRLILINLNPIRTVWQTVCILTNGPIELLSKQSNATALYVKTTLRRTIYIKIYLNGIEKCI